MAAPSAQAQDPVDIRVTDANTVTTAQQTDVLIAGGGGTGLAAALAAASDPTLQITVVEKAERCGGNTARSTGMIPAAETRLQAAADVEDSIGEMVDDILSKNDHTADPARVRYLCEQSAPLIHWLVDDWDVDLHIVDDFKYPKHSRFRMHAPPGRNGENLIAQLLERVEATEQITLHTETALAGLVVDDGAVVGAETTGGMDAQFDVGAAVVLATDGFAGNTAMIAEHCPEIADAYYYGSPGNTGDGIRLGAALGAGTATMDAYQAHASVAVDTELLTTYAIIMTGGVVLNEDGERFADETKGYSRFAVDILGQPGGVGYEIFDTTIMDDLTGEFEDFDIAVEAGTFTRADSVEELATALGCAPAAAAETVQAYNAAAAADTTDPVGRADGRKPLEAPFYGHRVTGSLFHTQGGLTVDEHARVLREDGEPIPGLYAGGGVAGGISGHGPGGYLSGNGLLTALGYGRLAGLHIAGA
jgi:fumarate reductase flavoprotein subunit